MPPIPAAPGNDNHRPQALYRNSRSIQQCIHGIDSQVGSVEVANWPIFLCSGKPGFFGVKAELGESRGLDVWARWVDANAVDSHPGPRAWPAMFCRATGQHSPPSCLTFLSQAALGRPDLPRKLGAEAPLRAVVHCRDIAKQIAQQTAPCPRWRWTARTFTRWSGDGEFAHLRKTSYCWPRPSAYFLL